MTPSAKTALRQQLRTARKALDAASRVDEEAQVRQRLHALLRHWQPARVAMYLAAGSELNLAPESPGWAGTGEIWLPVLGTDRLRFAPAVSPWQLTRVGTREPVNGPYRDIQDMTVCVLPLLACDAQGTRLGQGGGWYDRTLAGAAPRPLCIGVGFRLQRVPTLPRQAHDIPVDIMLTAGQAEAFTEQGQTWLSGC